MIDQRERERERERGVRWRKNDLDFQWLRYDNIVSFEQMINLIPSSSSILYIDMDRGDSESVYSFLESYYRCQVYYIWSSENFTFNVRYENNRFNYTFT